MKRTDIKGQAWHIDLASASHIITLGGHTNVMTMTCEATGMTFIDHLKSRKELPNKIEFRIMHFKNQVINIAFIRSDNELVQGKECEQIYKHYGLQLTPSAPYNPSQNGISERKNWTLFTKARAVLIGAGIPPEFWVEVIYYVNYMKNLIPRKDVKSSFENWYKYKPKAAYLKAFGSLCYSFDTNPCLKKVDNRAIRCRFLGHEGKSIYRAWDI